MSDHSTQARSLIPIKVQKKCVNVFIRLSEPKEMKRKWNVWCISVYFFITKIGKVSLYTDEILTKFQSGQKVGVLREMKASILNAYFQGKHTLVTQKNIHSVRNTSALGAIKDNTSN